jgi:hypothetical protein
MAYNQASFFLFPPRFGPAVEVDEGSRTFAGDPVELISSSTVDATAPEVSVQALRQWLIGRGFKAKERYGQREILFRGHHRTIHGTEEVIKLSLPLGEEEIQVLYIRFLLTEQTAVQACEWKDLLIELGDDFGFKIMDDSHELLPLLDFFTVLRENTNFREFQMRYGWKI